MLSSISKKLQQTAVVMRSNVALGTLASARPLRPAKGVVRLRALELGCMLPERKLPELAGYLVAALAYLKCDQLSHKCAE